MIMARVKLAYPKIPGSKDSPFKKCIAFEKYDGTNLHWIWDEELGWYAFGTRRDRFDLDERGIAEFNAAHPGLEEAPKIFVGDLAKSLDDVFKSNQHYHCSEITVFTEFLGAQSFAGMHKQDDPKQLVLFDVQTDQNMIDPEQFVRDFSAINIARVVYCGKLTGKFIEEVREGRYSVAEGVVCKGKSKDNCIWMVKIKTNDYMNKLQQAFKDDWESYWE
jgi:RNA ligase